MPSDYTTYNSNSGSTTGAGTKKRGNGNSPWINFQNWIDKASTGGRNQKSSTGGTSAKAGRLVKVKPGRKKKVQEAARRRSERYSEGYSSRKKSTQDLKNEAETTNRVLNNSPRLFKNDFKSRVKNNETAYKQYRAKRRAEGDFKGKYYGPDEFKGDERMLAKWRASGSPKITKTLIKNYSKSKD